MGVLGFIVFFGPSQPATPREIAAIGMVICLFVSSVRYRDT
jgi:TRAP-type C4-dicarboxylate transport system permease large subunit